MISRPLVRFVHFTLCIFVLSETILASAATVTKANAPLYFEPNQGQAPPEARYLLRDGPAEALFLQDGVSLILPQSKDSAFNLRIQFVGANPKPEIAALRPLRGDSNYLIGSDSSRWLHGLPNYAQVKYRGVYSGIDLLFYGNGHSLEHDFEVQPAPIRRGLRSSSKAQRAWTSPRQAILRSTCLPGFSSCKSQRPTRIQPLAARMWASISPSRRMGRFRSNWAASMGAESW